MADGVWVRTSPDVFGVYRCVVELDDDVSHPIDRDTAPAYVGAVLQAAARAEYDAAVIGQTAGFDGSPQTGGFVVQQLRDARPEILWPSPLSLTPGVSHRTGEGFLDVGVGGRLVGQWDCGQAREHALRVMEAVEVAGLDRGYLAVLHGIGVGDSEARAVVAGLRCHHARGGG